MKSKYDMVYNSHNFKRSLNVFAADKESRRSLKAPRLLLIAIVALFLSACATQPPGVPKSNEEIVAERAQARVDALLAGDLPAAWSYTTPGYRQRVTNPMHYSSTVGGSGNWISAEVGSVTCSSDEACTVRMMITYPLIRGGLENTRPLEERWIKTEGQWWIFHRR